MWRGGFLLLEVSCTFLQLSNARLYLLQLLIERSDRRHGIGHHRLSKCFHLSLSRRESGENLFSLFFARCGTVRSCNGIPERRDLFCQRLKPSGKGLSVWLPLCSGQLLEPGLGENLCKVLRDSLNFCTINYATSTRHLQEFRPQCPQKCLLVRAVLVERTQCIVQTKLATLVQTAINVHISRKEPDHPDERGSPILGIRPICTL